MTEEKTIISIVKNQGAPSQEVIDIKTNGFLLLYLVGDKIKSTGDIELKALAPIIMKLAIERMSE